MEEKEEKKEECGGEGEEWGSSIKTSQRRIKDVLKTSQKRLKDISKTSPRRFGFIIQHSSETD